jgi:hypothetical protein
MISLLMIMSKDSRVASLNESSPKKIIRSRHSSLIDLTNRSAKAFKFGERGGSFTDSTPDSARMGEELRGVERIAVVDQKTLRLQDFVFTVGDVASNLLHPESVGTLGDASELNAPRRELDEEENHEALEFGAGSMPCRLRMLAMV